MGKQTEILEVVRDQTGRIIDIKSTLSRLEERTEPLPELIVSHATLKAEVASHVEAHKEKRKWWMALWGSIAVLAAKAGFDFIHRNGHH